MKVLRYGHSLSLLSQTNARMLAVINRQHHLCYGQNCHTMSNASLNVWAAHIGKGFTSTPKRCSIRPTTEAFDENVKLVHHQACVWRFMKDADPPPTHHHGRSMCKTNHYHQLTSRKKCHLRLLLSWALSGVDVRVTPIALLSGVVVTMQGCHVM